jgi:hypothetical protein
MRTRFGLPRGVCRQPRKARVTRDMFDGVARSAENMRGHCGDAASGRFTVFLEISELLVIEIAGVGVDRGEQTRHRQLSLRN